MQTHVCVFFLSPSRPVRPVRPRTTVSVSEGGEVLFLDDSCFSWKKQWGQIGPNCPQPTTIFYRPWWQIGKVCIPIIFVMHYMYFYFNLRNTDWIVLHTLLFDFHQWHKLMPKKDKRTSKQTRMNLQSSNKYANKQTNKQERERTNEWSNEQTHDLSPSTTRVLENGWQRHVWLT